MLRKLQNLDILTATESYQSEKPAVMSSRMAPKLRLGRQTAQQPRRGTGVAKVDHRRTSPRRMRLVAHPFK